MRSPLVSVLALFALACGTPEDPARFGQVALAANLARAGGVALLAGTELDAAAAAAQRRWEAEGLVVERVMTPEGFRAGPRVVVGSPGEPLVAELLGHLGIELDGGRWRYLERSLEATEARIVATFEDPERPGLPLTLLAAGAPAQLGSALATLRPGVRPMLWMWRGPNPILSIRLTPAGAPIPSTLRDFTPRRLSESERYGRRPTLVDGWQAAAHPDVPDPRLVDYVGALLNAEASLGTWLELPERLPRTLWAEAHADGCVDPALDLDALAWVLPGRRVLAWLGEDGLHDGGAAHAAALARWELGDPEQDWLPEAVGVDAAGRWWNVPLDVWCAHLARGGVPPLAELMAHDACARYSPHRVVPLLAWLVREARESGVDLVAAWRDSASLLSLERFWRRSLDQLTGVPLERAVEPVFQGPYLSSRLAATGAPLASEGDGLTLDALARFEALALEVHIAPARPPSTGVALGGRPRLGLVGGDAAVIQFLRRARARGLSTVLCLERWRSHAAGPDGDRVLPGGADAWASFFVDGAPQIDHVALVAQLAEVDLLNLHTGQAEALHTVPAAEVDDPASLAIHAAREAGWRDWIATARASFDGRVTVAARNPTRFERFGDWSELDVAAVRLEPELATRELRALPGPALLVQRARLALRRVAERAPGATLLLPLELGWGASDGHLPAAQRRHRLSAFRSALGAADNPSLIGCFVDMGTVPEAGMSGGEWLALEQLLGRN